MSSIDCDVLIIGAGPAGLIAGLQLSKNGFSTVILEKNKNVGPKQTKYDITEGNRIHKILDGIDLKPNKISSLSEWISPNYTFVLDSKIEDYYFKRGAENDSIENILLKKITNMDVNVLFETDIFNLNIRNKEIIDISVKTRKEKTIVKPKYVIIADGAESELRDMLQIKTKIHATYRGVGVVVESEKQDNIPHAKIYFDEQFAPGGYIYTGSVDDKSFFCVVIDDIFTKDIKLQKNLESFIKNKVNRKINIKNFFDGIGKSGIHYNHIENVLLVGGAALFCDPFLGYGLNYAIESAFYAAKAIEKNNSELYSKYTNKVQEGFKEMFFTREIWRNADNEFFDEFISNFNGPTVTKNKNILKILELFDEN